VQPGNDEDSTPLRRDDVKPIVVVDRSMLINDELFNEENETTYDNEEELSSNDDEDELFSNDDTNSAHEEELSCNSDRL